MSRPRRKKLYAGRRSRAPRRKQTAAPRRDSAVAEGSGTAKPRRDRPGADADADADAEEGGEVPGTSNRSRRPAQRLSTW